MEIISNNEEMIFRKDYNGKPMYSIGLSKKDINGKYVNGYMSCYFKQGTDIADKTKIKIKDAWLSFYLKDKQTIPTLFINEYEIVEVAKPKEENDPFKEFGDNLKTESDIGEQIIIEDSDLPF